VALAKPVEHFDKPMDVAVPLKQAPIKPAEF
jgi:hypothetical protein